MPRPHFFAEVGRGKPLLHFLANGLISFMAKTPFMLSVDGNLAEYRLFAFISYVPSLISAFSKKLKAKFNLATD